MSSTRVNTFRMSLCILAGVFAMSAPKAQDSPAPPRLTFAFELRAKVGAPVEVGQVTHGRRRIVPIEGGTIKGPLLNGTVTDGGADWQVIQQDGFTELDTRYTIKTEQGALVYVQHARIRNAPPDGMQHLLALAHVHPELQYVR